MAVLMMESSTTASALLGFKSPLHSVASETPDEEYLEIERKVLDMLDLTCRTRKPRVSTDLNTTSDAGFSCNGESTTSYEDKGDERGGEHEAKGNCQEEDYESGVIFTRKDDLVISASNTRANTIHTPPAFGEDERSLHNDSSNTIFPPTSTNNLNMFLDFESLDGLEIENDSVSSLPIASTVHLLPPSPQPQQVQHTSPLQQQEDLQQKGLLQSNKRISGNNKPKELMNSVRKIVEKFKIDRAKKQKSGMYVDVSNEEVAKDTKHNNTLDEWSKFSFDSESRNISNSVIDRVTSNIYFENSIKSDNIPVTKKLKRKKFIE